jgi:hypothetical protein
VEKIKNLKFGKMRPVLRKQEELGNKLLRRHLMNLAGHAVGVQLDLCLP